MVKVGVHLFNPSVSAEDIGLVCLCVCGGGGEEEGVNNRGK